MNPTEQKIINFIVKHKLIDEGDKILVALSGGPDSVFALSFFYKFKKKYKIQLGAAHLNHLLRGSDAEEDMLFCKELSEKLSVEYYEKKEDVSKFAFEQKISFEEAGRELRYKFLDEIAETNNFNKIVTAHTINDNAETVLLNLLKGAGLNGLSGIPIKRGKLIRPLLETQKDDILDYLNVNNISFRTDKTNYDSRYQRNFLRNEIIPLIKKNLNPSMEETLFNSSEIFRSFLLFVDEWIKNQKEILVEKAEREIYFSVEKILKTNSAVFAQLLRDEIKKKFAVDFNYSDFEELVKLINYQTGKKILLEKGIIAIKERENIVITEDTDSNSDEVVITIGEQKKINSTKISISLAEKNNVFISNDKNTEFLNADDLDNQFVIRKWKTGDKFIPFGQRGYKTISDFLTDIKIPAHKKRSQLVLINRGNIVWLVGLRLDERVRIKPETEKVVKLWLS